MNSDGRNAAGRRQHTVAAVLPSITGIRAADVKAAFGLMLASPFIWDQDNQARSFGNRFFVMAGQMPDAAHAAAYEAARHCLPVSMISMRR